MDKTNNINMPPMGKKIEDDKEKEISKKFLLSAAEIATNQIGGKLINISTEDAPCYRITLNNKVENRVDTKQYFDVSLVLDKNLDILVTVKHSIEEKGVGRTTSEPTWHTISKEDSLGDVEKYFKELTQIEIVDNFHFKSQ